MLKSFLARFIWLGLLPAAVFASTAVKADEPADPHRWLEEIDSPAALRWVEQQNARTAARLTARPDYTALHRDALAVLNSQSRIPAVSAHGGFLYNLWQDAEHPRGVFRRTTPADLKQDKWETVLDVDALAVREGQPWALEERFWRRPDETRVLLELSPGGGDAVEVREFDVNTRQFATDGFVVPTAKSRVGWADRDTLYVATDFGPGTLTSSGYPRIVKRWHRGTPLSAAETLYEAPAESVWALARRFGSGAEAVHVLTEAQTYWTAKFFLIGERGLTPLAIPATAAVVDALRGRLVLWLKADWTPGTQHFTAGSVVIADVAALTGGAGKIDLLVAAEERVVVQAVDVGETEVLVTYLDNVRGRLMRLVPAAAGWRREVIEFPDHGALKVASVDETSGDAWVEFETFTRPPTLYRVAAGARTPEPVKTQAPTFDGGRFAVEQHWCVSADGTRVPYFVVGPRDLKRDGSSPVWMFSYGGFENSLTPSYSGSYEDLKGAYGKLWLERGGVFVLANIRGGGEFGPAWHTSVLKENHFKCFEDFEAVARDLVAQGITVPARLGIEGRSNGGLLVTATMLRHPELYGAIVCGNPLIDMQRYHRLLAGASWMAEYGNPDVPEEWAYIREYSPYQAVRPGMKLPPILFYTTTRDDRVHPGHARKMAAKMSALGYAVDYYENTEGGHHGSVTSEQLATRVARTFAFLWEKLGNAPVTGGR